MNPSANWWELEGVEVDLSRLKGMEIRQKIDFIQDFYRKGLFAPDVEPYNGIAFCMRKIDCRDGAGNYIRPLRPGDYDYPGAIFPKFEAYGELGPKNTYEYWTNENSITTSGLYLASQCYRYEATGDKDALEEAAKAFNSVCSIYALHSGVVFENPGYPPHFIGRDATGFMSKPFGFRLSSQTSGDQYLHVTWGLLKYHGHAEPAAKKKIETMIISFADFWKRVDYRLGYFGVDWSMAGDTGSYNAIMCMLQAAAYHFTSDRKYLDEAAKWYGRAEWKNPEANLIWTGGQEDFYREMVTPPIAQDESLWWEGPIHIQFVMVSAYYINIFTDLIKDDESTDMNRLARNWFNLWPVSVPLEGGDAYAPYYYFLIKRDGSMKWRPTGRTETLPEEQWLFNDPAFSRLSEFRWNEPLSRFVTAAALMHPFMDEDGKRKTKEIVLGILNALDGLRLHWIYDFGNVNEPSTRELHPGIHYLYNYLSSEAPSAYMIAYWLAKENGYV